MSKVDWSLAPEGATHYGFKESDYNACWYKKVCGKWFGWLADNDNSWDRTPALDGDANREKSLVARNKPWSGPEDGLPPAGLEIEARIDFKKVPPYTVIGLTELGIDVQRHVPRFQKVTVLYVSDKYLVSFASGVECLTPMSCVEIRAIKTKEQAANEKRETAIREVMDIAKVDCRVTAARLVDAGFKREVV